MSETPESLVIVRTGGRYKVSTEYITMSPGEAEVYSSYRESLSPLCLTTVIHPDKLRHITEDEMEVAIAWITEKSRRKGAVHEQPV